MSVTALQVSTDDNNKAMLSALRDSFYPGAKIESVQMVINYCRAAGLDPMTRPVHIVPMSVKKPGTRDDYEWRDVVMPGIELYRIKADRSGKYAGQDEAEFGPVIERWGIKFPEWCRVTVYKITSIGRVAVSAKAFWVESYATAKRGADTPNAMWIKRPYGQLEKCAEAAALRKAFPEIGGQPTAEEMAGKVIDSHMIDEHPDKFDPNLIVSRTDAIKARLTSRSKPSVCIDDVLVAIASAETMDALKAAGETAKGLTSDQDKEVARHAYAGRKAALEESPSLVMTEPSEADVIVRNVSEAKSSEVIDLWIADAKEQGLPESDQARIAAVAEQRRAELAA